MVEGLAEDAGLDLFEQVADVFLESGAGARLLLERVAAHDLDGVVLQVATAHGQTYGDALELVFGKLPSGLLRVVVVKLDADAQLAKSGGDAVYLFTDRGQLLGRAVDGDDDDLHGGEVWRQDEAVVVRVRHDERADEAGGDAPGRGPGVVRLAVTVDEGDVEGAAEVLSEEVRGAGLKRLTVLHHGLDGVRLEGAGEAFAGRLDAADDGHGHVVLGKVGIDALHLDRLLLGLLAGGVGRVAFLPEEFGGAKEEARAHLPTHDVGPLVDEDRQVAVGLDPVFIRVPDDCFGGGTDDELFLESGRRVDYDTAAVRGVLEPVMRHDGAFLGEAFDMVGLAAEKGFGDEQGEVSVLVARLLELVVQDALHAFPDGVAVGLDDHAAADG